MTGIERITEKIFEQSKINCDEIFSKTNLEIKKLIAAAREEGNRKAEKIVSDAQKEADKKIAVAKSMAESITRNRYLEIRNAILNDVISAAYLEIEKLSDEEYFEMFYTFLRKNALEGKCEMLMNGYDLSRLPVDFSDRISSAVGNKAVITLCENAIDVENGFILDYGSISVNCTFKAIFDESMDKLKDTLSKELFE